MKFISGNRSKGGHYSSGVVSRGMLYISGQLSKDPVTGKVPEPDMAVHMAQALSNLETVLKEAGLGRDSIVQCRVYVTDVHQWDIVNRVFGEFFGSHAPARIVVPVPELHFGCMVEIEAVAELPE